MSRRITLKFVDSADEEGEWLSEQELERAAEQMLAGAEDSERYPLQLSGGGIVLAVEEVDEPDLHERYAELRAAARAVLGRWESGDLAEAVRRLQAAVDAEQQAGG
jgi:hypothetical protein